MHSLRMRIFFVTFFFKNMRPSRDAGIIHAHFSDKQDDKGGHNAINNATTIRTTLTTITVLKLFMTISTFSVLENTIPIDSLYKKEAFQVSMEQVTVRFCGVGAGWMTGAGVLP